MIISFDLTSPALVAGRKTRTRRDWAESHFKKFHIGDLVQAWDHSPRTRNAKRIGTIRITGLKRENIALMPDEDFEKEGFAYLQEAGLKIWGKTPRRAFEDWMDSEREYYVVDFEKVN